jgi:hypothetical protein
MKVACSIEVVDSVMLRSLEVRAGWRGGGVALDTLSALGAGTAIYAPAALSLTSLRNFEDALASRRKLEHQDPARQSHPLCIRLLLHLRICVHACMHKFN